LSSVKSYGINLCYLARKKKLQHGDVATKVAVPGRLLHMAEIILPLVPESLLPFLCLFLLDLKFPAYTAHSFFHHRWEITYSTAMSHSSPSELAQKMRHECEKPLSTGRGNLWE